ncbi:unnamed protein product [Rangifer tarandus platyrhynchus]|uniref:Uncharacterized protein n=1 Tax=Rangifer tarandus platyrhynchus TaxID=3082113 RepID=A0ABN8XJ17_RANTA|nr:unnamed protein product [Rangifer tarandus platyrhynchus]
MRTCPSTRASIRPFLADEPKPHSYVQPFLRKYPLPQLIYNEQVATVCVWLCEKTIRSRLKGGVYEKAPFLSAQTLPQPTVPTVCAWVCEETSRLLLKGSVYERAPCLSAKTLSHPTAVRHLARRLHPLKTRQRRQRHQRRKPFFAEYSRFFSKSYTPWHSVPRRARVLENTSFYSRWCGSNVIAPVL